MRTVCLVLFTALGSGLRRQAALQIENAALRHQLAVLQRQKRGRPQLRPVDRLFWTWLCHLWPGWRRALVIVKPDTVLRWHRRGFGCYWRWKIRPRGLGRPRIARAVQALIHQMCRANPLRGATVGDFDTARTDQTEDTTAAETGESTHTAQSG